MILLAPITSHSVTAGHSSQERDALWSAGGFSVSIDRWRGIQLWLNDPVPQSPVTRRALRKLARKRRLHRRWWVWTLVGVVVIVLPIAWLGIRGWIAKGDLESAQVLLSTLKAQALAFDADGALESLKQISIRTEEAAALTDDPIWRAAEAVPSLGQNLAAVRELAAAAHGIVESVAAPLVAVVGTIDPAALAPKDGAIDLAPFIDVIPVLDEANRATQLAVAEVNAIDTDGTLPPIVAAKDKMSGLLLDVAPMLELANQVVPLLPPALGSDGLRTYVVMFQNNAEPRALGGSALSFAVVTVDHGRIALSATIPAGEFPRFDPPLVSFPEGAQNIYPDAVLGGYIPNVTTRPSFRAAAAITQETWLRSFGTTVDGIVSVDPVLLGYILRATDPIPLSTGDMLTSDSLVPLLLNEIYLRYNTDEYSVDNTNQDAFYSEAVSATFARLTSGPLKPVELVAAIVQGWNENRLLISSVHDDEQAALDALGLKGEMPVSDSQADRVGVYIQDYVGSKLGFYLQQSVHLSQAPCRADGLSSYRVTVDITHALDPAAVDSLSPSIVGTWEQERVPRGTQRLIVMIYAPPGSRFVGTNINGAPVALSAHHDYDYPVDLHVIEIPPGATTTLSYDIVAAQPGTKNLEAQVTPMVSPTTITTEPLDCATVPAA